MMIKKKVHQFCKKNKISIDDFATAIGVHTRTLQRYMAGTVDPRKRVKDAMVLFTNGFIKYEDFYKIKKGKK